MDEKVTETQEMYEAQLERKDDLRELANNLESIIKFMNDFSEDMSSYSDPSTTLYDSRHALWPCLHHLSKDILSYKHKYDEVPYINISVFQFIEGGEQNPIEDADTAIKLYDQHESPTISISLSDQKGYASEPIYCHLDDSYGSARKFKYQKDRILQEHRDLLDQFAPEILSQLEAQIDDILRHSINTAIQMDSQVRYDPDAYEDIQEISVDIYEDAIIYDGIEEDLNELQDLTEELKEIRKSAIQASFA